MKYQYFFLLALLVGCQMRQADYEQLHNFNDQGWHKDSLTSFEFNITEANKSYLLLYLVRSKVSYPYSNLYLRYSLKDSTGKLIETRLDEMYLADSKTGKPKGSGFGEIRDAQFQFHAAYSFPYSGKYILTLQHYMRQDMLPGIVSVGLRIEKSEVQSDQ